MAKDELVEINGIKPKVLMADGDEREVSSQTRYAVCRTRGRAAHAFGSAQ
jgi:hypothetical protein